MAKQVMSRAATVRLRLLGTPMLEMAAGPPLALERKAAGLLAMLALDGPQQRGKLAALLWPDIDAAAARNNLRQTLHRLRRRAGQEFAETSGDVLRLAAGVGHDIGGAAQDLAANAAAASGELLGGLTFADCGALDAWVQAARERWRTTRRDVLARLAAALEKEGHHALALEYAERLVADDPLLEHAHRRLMRLHYLRGDRAAALAAYARCRDALRRHLGASPSPETAELARLVEASGVLPAAAGPPVVALLRPPRLVGRDTEWRRLEIAAREGRFAVVVGEPGIGKSRLLGEFAARHGACVLVSARPGDERVPFVVLARLLRAVLERFPSAFEAVDAAARADLAHLLPELAAASPDMPPAARLQQAAGAALQAAPGLAGCIVDDLHFADEPSLDAVFALASSHAGRRVCWLASVRSADAPAPLAGWLQRSDPDDVERVPLGPLDTPAVQALLASLALPGVDARAWAEPLARHTGGNPLFILETLGLLHAEGRLAPGGTSLQLPAPATVEQLIERRLGRLTPEALRLARVAALAGPRFSPALAARVLGAHPLDLAGAWRELEAAQVLRGDAFAHDLVFEVVLRSVPEAIARLMRRDIAAAQGELAPPVMQHARPARARRAAAPAAR